MIDEKRILADCETALGKFPNSVVFRVVYEHVHALLAERKRTEELKRIGGMMANICWNNSQATWTINDRDRENMRECARAWDVWR